MVSTLKNITESSYFGGFIIFTILAAGALVGIETYPELAEQYGELLHIADNLILGIFVVEIFIKLGAEGHKPWNYFKDPWNLFDFSIVAVCLLPFNARYIAVLRLARLLRVLRLVTALPKLQILVGAILKSIPSLGYLSVLIFLHFYIYAVMGTFLFSENDPAHFGKLHLSLVSLFRVVTLEDWTDLMYTQMYGSDVYAAGQLAPEQGVVPKAYPILAAFYFISFILLGAMVIMNLFIGIILSGMDEARSEAEAYNSKKQDKPKQKELVYAELTSIITQVDELKKQLEEIVPRIETQLDQPGANFKQNGSGDENHHRPSSL